NPGGKGPLDTNRGYRPVRRHPCLLGWRIERRSSCGISKHWKIRPIQPRIPRLVLGEKRNRGNEKINSCNVAMTTGVSPAGRPYWREKTLRGFLHTYGTICLSSFLTLRGSFSFLWPLQR